MIKIVIPFIFTLLFQFSLNAQNIAGIDVSALQGTINWTQVAASGKSFAFIKATKGQCYTDSKFVMYMTDASSAGIKVGAYHFALPEDNSAEAEAQYFLNVAQNYIGQGYLPPVLDFEDPAGTCITHSTPLCSYYTPEQNAQWIQDFCEYIFNQTGVAPIVYTARCMATSCVATGIIDLNKYKLWIADYDECQTCPPTNSGSCLATGIWPTWLFKQYSSTGTVTGINTNVDLDVFNGTTDDFDSLLNPPAVLCNNDTPCEAKELEMGTIGNCEPTNCSTVNATADNIPFSGGASCSTNYQSGRYDDDVWFSMTPQRTDSVYITATPEASMDITVGLYEGNCNQLTQIGCATAGNAGDAEKLGFIPQAGTTYFIRVFSYGIGSQYAGNFSICANQKCPEIMSDTIQGTESVQAGTVYIYSVLSNNATNYQWTVPNGWVIGAGQGTNSIAVTPTSTSGTICVTPSNECDTGQTICTNVTVTGNTTSLVDLMKKTALRIYPNPAKEDFHLQYTLDKTTEVSAILVDAMGRQVRAIFTNQQQSGTIDKVVPTADLSNGIYQLLLQFDGKNYTTKIVVNK